MSEYQIALASLEEASRNLGIELPFDVDDLFSTEMQIAYSRILPSVPNESTAYRAIYGKDPVFDESGNIILLTKEQETDPQYVDERYAVSSNSVLISQIKQDKEKLIKILYNVFTINTILKSTVSSLDNIADVSLEGYSQASATEPPSPMSPVPGIVASACIIDSLYLSNNGLLQLIPDLEMLESMVANTSTANDIMASITDAINSLSETIKTLRLIKKPNIPIT